MQGFSCVSPSDEPVEVFVGHFKEDHPVHTTNISGEADAVQMKTIQLIHERRMDGGTDEKQVVEGYTR